MTDVALLGHSLGMETIGETVLFMTEHCDAFFMGEGQVQQVKRFLEFTEGRHHLPVAAFIPSAKRAAMTRARVKFYEGDPDA